MQWDFSASARVDHFLAASSWLARGIRRANQHEAEILFPPVVEVQSAGTPVIVFGGGDVCETVIEGKTGLFYDQQNAESLISAVLNFVEVEKQFPMED